MSSFYLPQPYNRDENAKAHDISETLSALIFTAPLRVIIIGVFRVLTAFIGMAINESQGKKPSRILADDRRQIMEFIEDLFDEQVMWSEKAQESQDRHAKAAKAAYN